MKIDAILGVVSFPGITIGPHFSRQEFLETQLGTTSELGVVNDGWVTLYVQPEPEIHASLAFKDDRLIKLEARNAFGFRNPMNQRLRSRCASIRATGRPAKYYSAGFSQRDYYVA